MSENAKINNKYSENNLVCKIQEVMKPPVFRTPPRRSKCPSLLMSSEQDLKQLCFFLSIIHSLSTEHTTILQCQIRLEVAQEPPISSLFLN